MINGIAARDEREITVDNAANRMAYVVLSFGLLALAGYRSFVHGEAAWDLMGLVILGGLVSTAYRAQQRALSGRWTLMVGLVAAVALVVAVILVSAKSV